MKYVKVILTVLLLAGGLVNQVQGQSLRRAIAPEQPAWVIHIDVWNYADPQKIIDMVPEDVRPYVIFNIATSSSDDKSPDGPAIYDSWMKVCAQNRVWTMIQCASGAHNRLPDTPDDLSAYEKYFKDYPNFLGFHFAEQFWDFGKEGYVTFPQRMQLFAKLLPLCKTYGGYLTVSFTDSYYNASKMPIAMMKRNSDIKAFLAASPENFICMEKYTQKKCFLDAESNCLGQWLAGYAGQYGIRFDSSGWVATDDRPDSEGHAKYTIGKSAFIPAAGAIPIAEHVMLTGQTIIDGPELIWTQCSTEGNTTMVDGYTRRNWQWFPQFENISLDLFRKILDGTIRIPTRQEVINRTKVCLINDATVTDVNNEGERTPYITPRELFDNLYRFDCDKGGRDTENRWLENHWWMKSTGRYPTIPQVFSAPDGMTAFKTSAFDKSNFDSWMQSNFPVQYSGDIYAACHENGWVTYNPYQYDDVTDGSGIRSLSAATRRAKGTVPFHYNTCTEMQLDYAPYSLGIVKEFADRLDIFLTNYQTTGAMSEDVIRITGATTEPKVTWKDRGSHPASTVSAAWQDGVLTVTVKHNGPLDMQVQCSGSATGRQTDYTVAKITAPALPPVYQGALQYEAELADYQQTTIRKSGYNQGRSGYQGQGFVEMTGSNSKLRFFVTTPEADYYQLSLCYQANNDGSMMVNDETVLLPKSAEWTTVSVIVQLSEGKQNVVLQNVGGIKTAVDYIRLETFQAQAFTPDANGEYHVPLTTLMATGALTWDVNTGTVTQQAGNNQTGTVRVFLNHADFSDVTALRVTYDGDGDLFRYLVISDHAGNSVNPTGYKGAFWSSKYNLNYVDYQLADASRKVCKIEWVADEVTDKSRNMTIKDILIRTSAATGVKTMNHAPLTMNRIYDLQGRPATASHRGLTIVRSADGKTTKRIK